MNGRHIKNMKWSLKALIRVSNYPLMKVIKSLLDEECIEVSKGEGNEIIELDCQCDFLDRNV
jgi:hypothetical protein